MTAAGRCFRGACALIALALPGSAALADEPPTTLDFHCNQRTGALFISTEANAGPVDRSQFTVRRIPWASLLKVVPPRNGHGDPLRSGSRVLRQACGPLTVEFTSGFLNANPQGTLGALDFPLVEIRRGRTILLPRTALEACEVNSQRYQLVGPCPERWARSITLDASDGSYRITLQRTFTDAEYQDVARVDSIDITQPPRSPSTRREKP